MLANQHEQALEAIRLGESAGRHKRRPLRRLGKLERNRTAVIGQCLKWFRYVRRLAVTGALSYSQR